MLRGLIFLKQSRFLSETFIEIISSVWKWWFYVGKSTWFRRFNQFGNTSCLAHYHSLLIFRNKILFHQFEWISVCEDTFEDIEIKNIPIQLHDSFNPNFDIQFSMEKIWNSDRNDSMFFPKVHFSFCHNLKIFAKMEKYFNLFISQTKFSRNDQTMARTIFESLIALTNKTATKQFTSLKSMILFFTFKHQFSILFKIELLSCPQHMRMIFWKQR